MRMVNWRLGSMGFSYADWSGPFYPHGLPAGSFLGYYARIFNAVEIDSTFYGAPRPQVVQRWAASVPGEFRFCLKTPQRITHELGLVNALGEMGDFLQAAAGLGPRLGAVLVQLPPSFEASRFEVLAAFIEGARVLAGELRLAVELRHASWHTRPQELEAVLRASQVAWAATEYPELPRQVHRTADFLYVRWIGRHGSYPAHTHERVDLTGELAEWQALLAPELPHVREVFGFFNNDYAGFAPATCQRFRRLVGLPDTEIQPARQGRLFG